MSKRKLKKIKLKKLKYRKQMKAFLLGFVAVLLILYMFFTIPPILHDKKIEKLGYSKDAIVEIKKLNIDDRLIEEQLFSKNLNNNITLPSFMPEYLELYLATDLTTEKDFRLYGKLINLNYLGKDIIKMYKELEFWEMTPLLVFAKVDVDDYILDVKDNRITNTVSSFTTTNDYTRYYEPTIAVADPNSIDKLVNKTYFLDQSYVPENLVELSTQYATEGRQLSQVAADALILMCNEAQKNGLRMYASSTYRDYQNQSDLYQQYVNKEDQQFADSIAARPGHSEHQTGLTVDMASTKNGGLSKFADSPEYPWMLENAHNFGYILRFPPGKEIITGYSTEEWHWRYVGVELATKVKESNLTYDEYYMLYID